MKIRKSFNQANSNKPLWNEFEWAAFTTRFESNGKTPTYSPVVSKKEILTTPEHCCVECPLLLYRGLKEKMKWAPKYSKIHNNMPAKTFRAFTCEGYFRLQTMTNMEITMPNMGYSGSRITPFYTTLTFPHLAREKEGGKYFQIIDATSY